MNSHRDDGGMIIIPECMSRISGFGEKTGQTVSIVANDGSITITTKNLYGNIANPETSHHRTDPNITVLTTITKRNMLVIPHELLARADMTGIMHVALYLMDLSTIVMFPLETKCEESRCSTEQSTSVDPLENFHPKSADEFFLVENRDEILKIRFSDIFYFEKVKSTHNTCVVFAGGMSTFKSDLQDVLNRLDGGFIQCHKAFIVNMTRVKRIEKRQGAYVLHLENNHSCLCSLFHRKAVMDWRY